MTLSVDLKTIPRHKETCTPTIHYTHHATMQDNLNHAISCKEETKAMQGHKKARITSNSRLNSPISMQTSSLDKPIM